MSEHKERMKQEYKDLKNKIDALNLFVHSNDIYNGLDKAERVLMVKQLGFMEAYLGLLEFRLWISK